MFLRSYEIKLIRNDHEYTKAEEFIDTFDHHSLNDEEAKLLMILSEFMGHCNEKHITPRYYLSPQEIKTAYT